MELTSQEKILSEKYQIFIGKQLRRTNHRVKGKNLVQFAKIFGNKNPKYVGGELTADGKPDYSKVVAHPCYANSFTVGDNGATFEILGWRFPPKGGEEKGKKLITNFGKLLHSGQKYSYTNAEVPIRHGQKLVTTGHCEKIYVKKQKLWLVLHLDTHSQDGKLVLETTVTVTIRKGGYGE